MIDKAIYVPLFTEMSASLDSPFFTLVPGEIALLQAFGFADYKERADTTELLVPQGACLEMLLFKESARLGHDPGACKPMSLNQYRADLLARDTVWHDGCSVMLTSCNNLMMLNIPGSYCFTLNDAGAIGNARIYMRIFTHEEFPWDSKFFAGE